LKLAILPSVVFAALGVLLGIGGTTFNYAEGLSYLSTDPAACANCHIMQPQYDAWQKASHHTAATCADCHLPPGFPEKYVAKAENGWNHSKAFTLQDFPEHRPTRYPL
jgi:cytochrome c nitrite reductase small subunit